MKATHRIAAAGLFALALTGEASAHTFGASGAGFAAGFAHPYLGLDHLLAMVAVGFWAAQSGRPALWQLPPAFLTLMAGGAVWANLGLETARAETGIGLSVLALGLLIAGRVRLPSTWSTFAVAVFALFHGYAHGLEMPEAASPGTYAAGFVLATASLHLVGIGFGLFARRRHALIRASGAAIAVAGAWLLAAW